MWYCIFMTLLWIFRNNCQDYWLFIVWDDNFMSTPVPLPTTSSTFSKNWFTTFLNSLKAITCITSSYTPYSSYIKFGLKYRNYFRNLKSFVYRCWKMLACMVGVIDWGLLTFKLLFGSKLANQPKIFHNFPEPQIFYIKLPHSS